MTISEYEALSGITVPAANQAFVTAQIARTKSILETLLGFTLDPELTDTNEYEEIGKTAIECSCPDVEMETLEDPDEVVYAYRLYDYNRRDKFLSIDPATAIHKVKLVKDGITFRTLDADFYRAHKKQGIIKFIEQCEQWCLCNFRCYCVQLAVDADWLWPDDLPADLLQVWADMITYYSDQKGDIKSETLGSHSYTKFTKDVPQELDENVAVIQKYAGPNGSASTTVTI